MKFTHPFLPIVCVVAGLLLSACGKQECDCKLLFPNEDSLMSIANSDDARLNEIVAEMYNWRWQKEKLSKQIMDHESSLNMSTMDIQSYAEFQHELERLQLEHEMAKLNERLCEERIKRQLFESSYDIEPYTGTCTMKTADGKRDSLKAEFEDGVIVGEWENVK